MYLDLSQNVLAGSYALRKSITVVTVHEATANGGAKTRNRGWGGWKGVNNVPLDIHLHDDLFSLTASTVPCSTDALRLIDVVGLGWEGGGWGVLITSLWTFIFMMISFCSVLPQYHETMLCIFHSLVHSFISFHFTSLHFMSCHSHSFIDTAEQSGVRN